MILDFCYAITNGSVGPDTKDFVTCTAPQSQNFRRLDNCSEKIVWVQSAHRFQKG